MATFEEMTHWPVELYCEGCKKTFKGTAQEAFEAGWDCPPWFTSHVTCPDCPISSTTWWSMMTALREANRGKA